MDTYQQSGNNPWFGVSMGLVGLILGYFLALYFGGAATPQFAGLPLPSPSPTAVAPTAVAPTPTQPAAPAPSAGDVIPVDTSVDHIRGNLNATVSVIEYSDYECPFCKRHHPTMQQVLDEYGDDVNWVYRHFPLSFHPNAQKAAEASECAAELGGNDVFWEYADTLFDTQGEWAYEDYATDLGLDATEFNDCLDSGKFASLVKKQFSGGSAAGVRGTPGSVIINNDTGETKLISGAVPFTTFQSSIDTMLN